MTVRTDAWYQQSLAYLQRQQLGIVPCTTTDTTNLTYYYPEPTEPKIETEKQWLRRRVNEMLWVPA